ncbi:MAG: hypothetical protein P1U56_08840 [Saprospiraceae bacterium]|nr:hypothetical protein [Saprospiraceae bacterium]
MISTGQVTGTWKNSKSNTIGIAGFTLEEINNSLFIKIQGVKDGLLPESINDLKAHIYTASAESDQCIAFDSSVKLGDRECFFAGNVNKGLIIIATYIKMNSDSDNNLFVREFFYKLK